VAHGYNSAGVDDGGGVVRPYYNAIHGHWSYNPSPGAASSATLPGFDVFAGSALTGAASTSSLSGAKKWIAPPMSPPAGTIPDLVALDASEEIFITYGTDLVSTNAMGSFQLVDNVSAGGVPDIDLSYDIAARPAGVLMVLEFVLSTDAAGIASSDTVYIILSPDGDNPMQKLHHASLYLESSLGTPVPGPAAGAVLIGAAGLASRRRR
jgi:hypothetical protein